MDKITKVTITWTDGIENYETELEDEFAEDFDESYAAVYAAEDAAEIGTTFERVVSIEYEYEPEDVEPEDADFLYESMRDEMLVAKVEIAE